MAKIDSKGNVQFWEEIEDEKGNVYIKIIKADFILFLEKKGYRKLIQNKDFQLIKIFDNSIISAIMEHSIRSEVKNHLFDIGKSNVWEVFLGQDYVAKRFIEGIDSITVDFDYGTENTAVFFYRNGVLQVTSNGFIMVPYIEYDGYVWENQILGRDFTIQSFDDCKFRQFCWNIAGQKEDRLLALETLIGYLLHTYKDPSLTKAIILMDEHIDLEVGRSNGGTGKTLIADGIKQIIPSLRKNGKLLKPNDRFFFSDVEPYHKVIVFDDVKDDFSFESLYSMITGDMPIEKKYKNAVIMDFKDVPKVLITSNYVVTGTGGNSEKRRKVTFEVGSHYGENNTVIQEFGHRFFNDWTNEEWLKFDNYMMFCVQQYLNSGLIEAPSINENKNRLIQDTHSDFVTFMDTVLENPSGYGGEFKDTRLGLDKAVIYQNFANSYPELSKQVSSIQFKKWIDIYCDSKKLEIEHKKSNGHSYVVFIML
ncbi:primase-helicase family protein [Chryseobacterium sp. JV274]|uniref:primase-helicase family protein n=1 Tax=Chryseobacterium sp. JV274 TaxID=1932669 RepID=UPI0009877E6F|nr:primase-helicase family protein [Chryseobacterium sp. JV274]